MCQSPQNRQARRDVKRHVDDRNLRPEPALCAWTRHLRARPTLPRIVYGEPTRPASPSEAFALRPFLLPLAPCAAIATLSRGGLVVSLFPFSTSSLFAGFASASPGRVGRPLPMLYRIGNRSTLPFGRCPSPSPSPMLLVCLRASDTSATPVEVVRRRSVLRLPRAVVRKVLEGLASNVALPLVRDLRDVSLLPAPTLAIALWNLPHGGIVCPS